MYETFCFSLDKDPHEMTLKVNELMLKLNKAREEVDKFNGIDLSQEEQERQMEVLRKQLITKTELLNKYKHMCNLDIFGQTQ